MRAAFAHIKRLVAIGRILARHDALDLLDLAPLPAPLSGIGEIAKNAWAAFGGKTGQNRPQDKRQNKRLGEKLALAFYDLGPSFIKLGQGLSVRPDIVGEDMAKDLSQLRDRLPPFPASLARAAITAEFGADLAALYRHFEDKPVAAASIAQVHFATTSDGREVAVKVLRPGIEAAFQRDLDLFRWLARLVEPRLKRLRPIDTVETLAETVAIEMDLRFEAAAASELAENFRDDPDFRVPKVDWVRTGRRVLTLERVHGIPIDDKAALLKAGHEPSLLGARVIRTFLKQTLRDGFFHADLHQGNLFVAKDGALELVDFGIMGRLDKPTRRFMAELLLAFIGADYRRAAEVHFEAGYVPASRSVDAFAQALRSVGEPILGRPVNEISIGRLLAQLFQITEAFNMATQPKLLLLQKTMVTAEGVARSLDPEINFWAVAKPVLESWMVEQAGPEARLKDAADVASGLVQRLPGLAVRFERAVERIAEGGVRLDAESLERLAFEQSRARRPLVYGVWALVILLFLLLLLLD